MAAHFLGYYCGAAVEKEVWPDGGDGAGVGTGQTVCWGLGIWTSSLLADGQAGCLSRVRTAPALWRTAHLFSRPHRYAYPSLVEGAGSDNPFDPENYGLQLETPGQPGRSPVLLEVGYEEGTG